MAAPVDDRVLFRTVEGATFMCKKEDIDRAWDGERPGTISLHILGEEDPVLVWGDLAEFTAEAFGGSQGVEDYRVEPPKDKANTVVRLAPPPSRQASRTPDPSKPKNPHTPPEVL